MPNPEFPRTRRLLLVDDDMRSARVLAKLLREDGFVVDVAPNGAAAIGKLSRPQLPDVLLLGLRLLHSDSVAVIRFARSRKPLLPVFVMIGHVSPLRESMGPMEPPLAIFTKPIDYAALQEALLAATPMDVLEGEGPRMSAA